MFGNGAHCVPSSYEKAYWITRLFVFNFVGQPNHENHENKCPTNIYETTVSLLNYSSCWGNRHSVLAYTICESMFTQTTDTLYGDASWLYHW